MSAFHGRPPRGVRELKFSQTVHREARGKSHPMWVRELKLGDYTGSIDVKASRAPHGVRELKCTAE